MKYQEFWDFFSKISKYFTVSLIAKEIPLEKEETTLVVEGDLPIFDSIELLEKYSCLVLPDGKIVKRKFLLKRPLRILLFIFLAELESTLYRIQEWSGRELKELNEKNMNDLIRDLLNDKKLFTYQKEYPTRALFKEDLKAVSAVRNLIVHVNKKLELETDFETIAKRKRQMQKLYIALSQIIVEWNKERNNGKNTNGKN